MIHARAVVFFFSDFLNNKLGLLEVIKRNNYIFKPKMTENQHEICRNIHVLVI